MSCLRGNASAGILFGSVGNTLSKDCVTLTLNYIPIEKENKLLYLTANVSCQTMLIRYLWAFLNNFVDSKISLLDAIPPEFFSTGAVMGVVMPLQRRGTGNQLY